MDSEIKVTEKQNDLNPAETTADKVSAERNLNIPRNVVIEDKANSVVIQSVLEKTKLFENFPTTQSTSAHDATQNVEKAESSAKEVQLIDLGESSSSNGEVVVSSQATNENESSPKNKDDDDDGVYYISEDEEPWTPTPDSTKSFNANHRHEHFDVGVTKSSTLSNGNSGSSLMNEPSPSWNTKQQSYAQSVTHNYSSHKNAGNSSNPTAPKTVATQKSGWHLRLVDLHELGAFIKIDTNSETYQTIHEYAMNSINLYRDSKMKLKILGVYKFNAEPQTSLMSKARKFMSFKSKDLSMLLWFKTTPESIRHLCQGKDSCMAFYDRLCRALPIPVSEITGSSRHAMLLCKVRLGKMHKSPQGYSRWHKEMAPYGSDSVKGVGMFRPDWSQNKKFEDTIVPCGLTERDMRYPKFELEFNEYMVFEENQVKIEFAVDIEICEKTVK